MSRRRKTWCVVGVVLVLYVGMLHSWPMSDEQREARTEYLVKELWHQAPRPWWKHDKLIEWGWVDEHRSTDAILADLAYIESQVEIKRDAYYFIASSLGGRGDWGEDDGSADYRRTSYSFPRPAVFNWYDVP